MLSRTSRPIARCARQQVRMQPKTHLRNKRLQSTSSAPAAAGGSSALIGGVAGGAVALLGGYAWYHISGTRKVVKSAKQTQDYVNLAKQKIAEKTPEPNEAFDWLRDTAKSYAAFIPGAKGYVDTAFDDLDKIRGEHGEEFDKIVRDAYAELKEVSKKGAANADTAFKAVDILQKHLNRLFELAGDAADGILDNHPQLKEKVYGSFDQLKQMGDAYGPQAKEEVNKTWQQISDIVKGGATAESAEEIQNLIKEKKKQVQKFGDKAWQKGIEEIKPYLDKNPTVKKLVEDNANAFKEGNFMQLWSLVMESASSGKTEDLEKYVKEKVDHTRNSGLGNLDKWLKAVPGGSDVIPQLQSLQTMAEKRGKEAEKIFKETVDDIQGVLTKRKEQIEKVAEDAKEESK